MAPGRIYGAPGGDSSVYGAPGGDSSVPGNPDGERTAGPADVASENPYPRSNGTVPRRRVARLTLTGGVLLTLTVVAASLVVQAAAPDRNSTITGPANQVPAWVYAPSDNSVSEVPAGTPSVEVTEAPVAQVPAPPPVRAPTSPAPKRPRTPATTAVVAQAPAPASLLVGTRRSLRLAADQGRYVRQRNGLVFLDPVTATSPPGTREQATFTVVTGLSDRGCFSFRGADGRYLRHYGFRIRYDADDRSSIFERDATFCARPFGPIGGAVVLESTNYRGRFLRHKDGELWLGQYQNSPEFTASVLFQATAGWS